MTEKSYCVYIITNKNDTTFYIGVTNDLFKRLFVHKTGLNNCFSRKYCLNKLVYYEEYWDVRDAIAREKQLKNWHRDWKLNLIRENNPRFNDLADEWFEDFRYRKIEDAETSSA